MHCYVPTDDYRRALERARRAERVAETDANQEEVDALVEAVDDLSDVVERRGRTADPDDRTQTVAEHQLRQLRARVRELDGGDLRFDDTLDALWSDVQDFAFRIDAPIPDRPVAEVVAFAAPGPPSSLRQIAVNRQRQIDDGQRGERRLGRETLVGFAIDNAVDRRPARSAFHRSLEAQTLVSAGLLAEAGRRPVGERTNPPPKPTPPTTPVNTAPPAGGIPKPTQPDAGQDLPPDEVVAIDDLGPDDPVETLIARALAGSDQVEPLAAAFRQAGIEDRAAVLAAAADRSLGPREAPDRLRVALGRSEGLDQEASYGRFPGRADFQAIVRAARSGPDLAATA